MNPKEFTCKLTLTQYGSEPITEMATDSKNKDATYKAYFNVIQRISKIEYN